MLSKRSSIELFSLLFLLAAVLTVSLLGKPFQRGFWCDDQTIRHSLKTGTVGFALLLTLSLVLPPIMGFLLENFANSNLESWRPWKATFWSTYCRLSFSFYYGFLITWLVTDVTKYSVGRLRPNFMDICKPSPFWNQTVCADFNDYIENYKCEASSQFMATQAHLSFFSGHSSLMAHAMVYIVLTLERRLTAAHLIAVRLALQCCAIIVALWVGYTRISDYWHHTEDVAVGLFVGTLIAYFLDRAFKSSSKELASKRSKAINGCDGDADCP